MRMAEQRFDGAREPKPESNDPGWFPLIAGLLGFAAGGALGWLLGLKNGPDNALQLGLLGGFIGMVLAVVPATKRQRPGQERDEISQQEAEEDRSLLTMITSLRRAKASSAARTPDGGLETRPVPNRNADPTGHIQGGLVVRVVRRSGIWARIEVGDESQDPIWVKRRELEPFEAPSETSESG